MHRAHPSPETYSETMEVYNALTRLQPLYVQPSTLTHRTPGRSGML